MKKMNITLILGVFIVATLLLMSFFPRIFSNNDPNLRLGRIQVHEVEQNGEAVREFRSAPHPPSSQALLGTDEISRDVYTRIIHGTKVTLTCVFWVSFFRILVGLPIGLLAGMRVRYIPKILRVANSIFTTIPSLILCFVILNIEYIRNLPLSQSMPIFIFILTFVGWPKLASLVEEKTTKILGEEFIEGEIALGKTRGEIVRQNVIPHLTPSLISWGFLEMGLILFLLAQLSILGVFIGPRQGAMIIDGNPSWFTSLDPEWSSMLSRAAIDISRGNYWLVFFPSLAFFIGITGFNLLGEGLKEEFNKRDSRVVSIIRRLGYQLSPKLYLEQVKNLRRFYRPVLIKSSALVLLLFFVFYPNAESLYAFNDHRAVNHLEAMTHQEKGEDGVREYIIDEMKRIGLLSFPEEGYGMDSEGETLVGVIPGENWERVSSGKEDLRKDYIIIIGARYDGIFEDDKLSSLTRATAAANNLALAETLINTDEPLSQTTLIVFWDGGGEMVNMAEPNRYMVRPVFSHSQTDYVYIDMGYAPNVEQRSLQVSLYSSRAQHIQFQSLMHSIQENLEKVDLRHHFSMNMRGSGAVVSLYLNSRYSLMIGQEYYQFMEDESNELFDVNFEFMKKQGQFVVDFITMTDLFD